MRPLTYSTFRISNWSEDEGESNMTTITGNAGSYVIPIIDIAFFTANCQIYNSTIS